MSKPWAVVRFAVCAVLAVVGAGTACRAPSARQTPAAVASAAQPVTPAQAQTQADFVIYLPTYLPPGVPEPRLLFTREQGSGQRFVPNRLYATYGSRLSLWQMPSLGRPLRRPAVPVNLGGRMGWASEGPRPGETSLEWRQGDTQLGLAGRLPLRELLKVAGSAVQAAPQAAMAQPSANRLRYWAPASAHALPGGGIGVMLAPGAPPTVLWVEPGSPAARAGVQPGDVIAAVDGRSVARLSVFEVTARVRGRPGTTVRLTLLRRGERRVLHITMQRAALPTYQVEEVTVAEARRRTPFPVLEPRWLPPGYRLVTCAVVSRGGEPWEVRLIYHAPGRPLLLVSETDAQTERIVTAAGKDRQVVQIGGADGLLSTRGGVAISWSRGATSVLVQSRAMDRAAALRVARSIG